jgi:recombination protein RecA
MAKKKKEEPTLDSSTVDALSTSLIYTLNNQFKSNPNITAHYLSDTGVMSDVKEFISTGSDMLDLAIGNRPNSGHPEGRIVEIFGDSASGKSLLAAYAMANTQKKGGLGIYIDTEAAVSREYFKAVGVDIDKMIYLQIDALEDIFEAIESIITKTRASDKDIPVTIVVDSVMGATTKLEMEADFDKEGWNTAKAIILSKAMRKLTTMLSRQRITLIFTNQIRSKLGGLGFGEQITTSGGKALPFAASVRIRLKSMGQIKLKVDGIEQIVGIKTRAIIAKNRLGPPLKSIDYDVYFDSGIDNYGSWLTFLNSYNLVKSGTSWTLPLEYISSKTKNAIKFNSEIINPTTGEVKKIEDNELKFRSKDFATWMEINPELRQWIYELICDKFITEYKINQDYGIDDVELGELE